MAKPRHRLSKHVALMAQTPCLFNNTFAHNIGYGRPDATELELQNAAKRAGIHNTITSLPEKYDATVGESGGVRFPSREPASASRWPCRHHGIANAQLSVTGISWAARSRGLRWHARFFKRPPYRQINGAW